MLSGSTNCTHGGLENNKEHLYKIREPSFVDEALADFEQTWAIATPVTQEVLDRMISGAAAAAETSRRRNRRTRSQEVSRSLSQELEGIVVAP